MATARPKISAPVSSNQSVSVDVRKIDNGYIVRKSTYDDKGNYKSSERFSATKPTVGITQTVAAPRKPGK